MQSIFVVLQLLEKYLTVGKRIYMAFTDLEKVIWWAMRKLLLRNAL